MSTITRRFYLFLGFFSLFLGIIGIFIPLLPTTPFIILAAFCFSKTNKKLHRWLRQHRLFGGPLRDWESRGVIKIKYKIIATFTVVLSLIYPLFFRNFDIRIKILVIATVTAVFTFIWTRPSRIKS